MIKAIVEIVDPSWHGFTAERLWVSKAEGELYTIENIPLYVLGYSYKDLVIVEASKEGTPKIAGVHKRSGHSTYRLVLLPGMDKSDFNRLWPSIEQLGCSYESSKDPEVVFGVDVPAGVDVQKAYDLFELGSIEGVWDFEEGYYFSKIEE